MLIQYIKIQGRFYEAISRGKQLLLSPMGPECDSSQQFIMVIYDYLTMLFPLSQPAGGSRVPGSRAGDS